MKQEHPKGSKALATYVYVAIMFSFPRQLGVSGSGAPCVIPEASCVRINPRGRQVELPGCGGRSDPKRHCVDSRRDVLFCEARLMRSPNHTSTLSRRKHSFSQNAIPADGRSDTRKNEDGLLSRSKFGHASLLQPKDEQTELMILKRATRCPYKRSTAIKLPRKHLGFPRTWNLRWKQLPLQRQSRWFSGTH